jgi:hypothetical protein
LYKNKEKMYLSEEEAVVSSERRDTLANRTKTRLIPGEVLGRPPLLGAQYGGETDPT